MSWRKNVFSYLLWVLYTVMVGTLMVGIGNIFCGDNFSPYYGAVFAVVLMAALGGTAFLLHYLAPRLRAHLQKKEKLRLAVEVGILTVLLVFGVMFRVEGFQSVEKTAVYYEMAEVTMEQDMPQLTHGAVYVYVHMLHLVLLFFGNHYAVGIIVQVIFQGSAALLLYFLVRKYVGQITALVVAGFFMCAPYMVRGGLMLSPDAMYLCFFAAAGSVTTAACVHGIGNVKAGRKPSLLFFIFAGIVSSVTAYLDVAGILLLLFSAGTILGMDRNLSGHGRKVMSCLCCVLGFVLGFAGSALVDSLIGAKSFGGVLQTWFQIYRPETFLLPATAGMPDSRVESLVLTGLMALGIYSFWFKKNRESFTVCMLASCTVILAGCFGIFTPEMPGTLFLYLLFAVMAGMGLQQCFSGREVLKTQVTQTKEDESKMKGQELQLQKQEVQKQEVQEQGLQVQKQEVQVQVENRQDALNDREEPTEKKQVKYLDNPLPLPKKHEKKVLDYDYPVADDDDFDI